MELLDSNTLTPPLVDLPGWQKGYHPKDQERPDCLFQCVRCLSLAEGMALAGRVAAALDAMQDHFAVGVYGMREHTKVTFLLRTWGDRERGPVCGVTREDLAAATTIETILGGAYPTVLA